MLSKKSLKNLFQKSIIALCMSCILSSSIPITYNPIPIVAVADAASYSNSTIKKVQEKLNDAGYDCGTADGVAGKNTKAAIKKYQKAKKLKITGVVDKKLCDSLDITPVVAVANNPKKSTPKSPSNTNNTASTVYVTETGKKYHRDGCRYLSRSQISISLEDAKASYSPCSVCKP